jgi:uncharacterized protein YbjT (DUF2867 family)
MKRRVVTVFGGSGFLGRHLVRRLAKADAIVRVAVRDPHAAGFLKTAGSVGQIVPLPADVRRPDTVAAALDGATDAVNLVGLLAASEKAFTEIHVDGAASVARAAAAAGIGTVVQVSAIGADPQSPSVYARTKAAGEAAVRDALPSAAVLRPSVVFGPEDSFFNLFAEMTRFSPALPVIGAPALPRLIRDAEGGSRIDLFGAGGPRFQPVYVGDVAAAIVAGLESRETRGRTYELGGPRVYTFKEIMQLVLAETRRWRLLLPVPYWAATLQGFFLEKLPGKLLTRDQVRLLRRDNIVAPEASALADLGIAPTPLEVILPTYLARFRLPSRLGRREGMSD